MTPQVQTRVLGYGDFNCPWSYLVAQRLARLEATGVEVDWRAVEHDPWRPQTFMDSSVRFQNLKDEMEHVEAMLLPGEELPYSLAGFIPYTAAAISGYAEAYGAGRAGVVRDLLLEAFWVNGVDLGDARLVRTLLSDAIRSGSSRSAPLNEWGYAVDVTGGPVTTTAWRLIRSWIEEWHRAGDQTVPVLVVDGGEPLVGMDAVRWAGTAVADLGELRALPSYHPPEPRANGDLASLSWVSEAGNRWLRDYRQAHRTVRV